MSTKTFGCLLTSEDLAQLQRVHTYITGSQIRGVESGTEYYLLVADNNNAVLSKLISAEVEVEQTPFDLLVRKWLLVPYSDQGNYGLSFKVELDSGSGGNFLRFESSNGFHGSEAIKKMSARGVTFPNGGNDSDQLRRYLEQKGLRPDGSGSFPWMSKAECLAVVCHLRNLYGVAPMPASIVVCHLRNLYGVAPMPASTVVCHLRNLYGVAPMPAPIIVTTKPEASEPTPQEPKKYIPGKWYMWGGHKAMCLGRRRSETDSLIYFGRAIGKSDVNGEDYPDLPKQYHKVAERLNYSIARAAIGDSATKEVSAPEGYETEDAPVTGFESRGSHAEPSAAPANTYVLSTGVTLIPGKWYTVNDRVRIFLGAERGHDSSFVKFGCYSSSPDVSHDKFPMLPPDLDVSRVEWEVGNEYPEWDNYTIRGPFGSSEEAEASIGKPSAPPKSLDSKPASSEEEIGVDALVPGKWYLWKSGGKSAWNMQQGVAAMYLGRRTPDGGVYCYFAQQSSHTDLKGYLREFGQLSDLIKFQLKEADQFELRGLSHSSDARFVETSPLLMPPAETKPSPEPPIADKFTPGTRVRRGPDWMWNDQDGGKAGTVKGPDSAGSGWVTVKWDGGITANYKVGAYNQVDLEIISEPEPEQAPAPPTEPVNQALSMPVSLAPLPDPYLVHVPCVQV